MLAGSPLTTAMLPGKAGCKLLKLKVTLSPAAWPLPRPLAITVLPAGTVILASYVYRSVV